MPAGVKLVLGLSSLFVILYVLVPAPLGTAAAAAARSLF
jgi:NADH-quinone oxidoreductase subunit N